jgi:hypothetical protein
MKSWLLLILILTGCQTASPSAITSGISSLRPIVQAEHGASATLDLTACPSHEGINQLQSLITMLNTAGLLVEAHDGGSAKLSIDICPFANETVAVGPKLER